MIPKNAIKKVKNEIHLEIAAGSLIAYGVFPQTAEGIQKAKETAASKDTWLAPSDLPEYYADIDSDLLMGKENDAIRAIRKTLKEFYGISSAGTEEEVVDTRGYRPEAPPGILHPTTPWIPVQQVGPSAWLRLKGSLTGKKIPELSNEQIRSYVKLSDADADKLIENIKKGGYYPQIDFTGPSGDAYIKEAYQNWLVDTYLPNYGKTQVYNPGDKFVDDGKEFADKIVTDLDDALEEKSNEIMDDIDAIIAADKKKYEDFKKQLNRKVDHPELYEELQHIQPRYMWGQNGLYDLEFKSDIDRAIYFAGKLSTKDTPDKVAVRAWLKDVTGLDVREDYREVKEYRNKILALILQLVKLHPNERDVVVPPVYDGYYQDPEEEEEEEDEEEMDDEEYDDLYGSNLDDLLDSLKDDEGEDPEEIAEEIEEKKQELEEAAEEDEEDFGSEDDIPDELLRDPVEDDEGDIGSEDDIPDELFDDTIDPSILEEIINKRKGKTGTKEKKSYYVSNTKLLQGITQSLAAVTGQLEQVNQSLLEQNQLIQTNIDLNLASLEALQAQDDILTTKFDAILNAFQQQYEASQKAEEDAKRLRAEQRLEEKTLVAGSENPEDLTKGGSKGKGGRAAFIKNYFLKKFGRKLYRKVPKRLRKVRTKVRKAQRIPGKVGKKVVEGVTKKLPSSAQKIVGGARQGVQGLRGGASGLTKGAPGLAQRLPGLRQALAFWEYGERKKEGQSDFQALSGIGAGLAGAAAGGAVGAKAGAVTGAAIGALFGGVGAAPGALIGSVLGGVFGIVGGFLGGNAASGAVDTLTGADKVGEKEPPQFEIGTPEAKPGTAMLHGTELLISKDKEDIISNNNPLNSVGATLVSAASKFITGLGPAGSSVAPLFEQKAAPLLETFGAPATTAQTNVGGSFPSIGSTFKKVEKKKEDVKSEEELLGKEFDDLIKGDSESFADKLLKIVDPEGKIQQLMSNIGGGGGGGGGDPSFTPSSGDPSGLADAAESLRGMSSASAPNKGGNGCVWAVNKVYAKAGITPPWGSSLYVPDAEKKMISAGYTQVGFGERKPGDIMVMYDRLSPPQAHIGVVLKNGNVLSNSSSKAKFAWEASPEEYNSYYGGSGKIYRMPSTMAKTESNKLKPVATTPTPNLSSTNKKGSTSNVVSNAQTQVTPTTTIAQSKPKQQPTEKSQPAIPAQSIASNSFDDMGEGMNEGDDMVAVAYGDGFPKTPKWMKEVEREYNKVKDKPFSPGTPKPGRGMGDTWMPQASVNSADEIARLSISQQESENSIILINNQAPSSQQMPSIGRTEIIQMGGNDSSKTIQNLILQRLA